MNRSDYFNYIESKLNWLAERINSRGKINILDLHLHSESFYLQFFNLLYEWQLINLNTVTQNVEAIDLVDNLNKYVVQISATSTKQKIETALKKNNISNYMGYRFKFISISKDATDLKKQTFANPHKINFDPLQDIFDITTILTKILSLGIDEQKRVYNFIKNELGNYVDYIKLDSNLATIINILSKEPLDYDGQIDNVTSFEIERKIGHNKLATTKTIIDDYSKHHAQLDEKYTQFDLQGVNKSYSILQLIKKIYVQEQTKLKNKNSDKLFFKVLEAVKNKVISSSNYIEIPIDELELCVNIVVVDAFIRCKIFDNPGN